jgi:hypothetical protein
VQYIEKEELQLVVSLMLTTAELLQVVHSELPVVNDATALKIWELRLALNNYAKTFIPKEQ